MDTKTNGASTLSEETPSIQNKIESETKDSKIDAETPSNNSLFNTPLIPEYVYKSLPELLQKWCEYFTDKRERDVFLISALTILSGCMESVHGFYDGHKVNPNLFLFIVAPAASGKSSMKYAKKLGMSIHRKFVRESSEKKEKYKSERDNYEASKKRGQTPLPLPVKPKFKVLFIPANISSSAMINYIKQAEGSCIIAETEADTMSNSFNQEWGAYSDMMRKAFQHEDITYSRKGKEDFNEFIEIEYPELATLLTGTFSQVKGIISSAENGLFSRFIFYVFKAKPIWRDVFPNTQVNINEYFEQQSKEVEKMNNYLKSNPSEIQLKDDQKSLLHIEFTKLLNHVSTFISEDLEGSVKRLGLIQFRICMILTAIRKYEKKSTADTIKCDDDDFLISSELVKVYMQHSLVMFKMLPKSNDSILDPNKKRLFDALPAGKEFTRQEAGVIASSLGITSDRTVNAYLQLLVNNNYLQKPKHGIYIKEATNSNHAERA